VKLDEVIVVASIARENVAWTVALAATPVAFAAGVVEVTVGATFAVVKLHETADASGTPSAALTVVASLAVYVVFAASAADGVSVAVFEVESYATVAATEPPPELVSVKLEPVSVVASIARENVALAVALVATSVAPATGLVDVTVGATFTVVKLQL
jgi:uroporphyrinogen-III decarboxylase